MMWTVTLLAAAMAGGPPKGLVIEDGHIVERGRHEELMALEGRYHQLYTVQARI